MNLCRIYCLGGLRLRTAPHLRIERILKELGLLGEQFPVNVFEDNPGAVQLAKKCNFTKNSKHVDIVYHFVHDYEKEG